jgi:hypothetical protein
MQVRMQSDASPRGFGKRIVAYITVNRPKRALLMPNVTRKHATHTLGYIQRSNGHKYAPKRVEYGKYELVNA